MIKEWQGNSLDPGFARVNGCVRNPGVSLKCRVPPFSLSSRCNGYGLPAVSVAQDFWKVKSATRVPRIPLSLRYLQAWHSPALPEPEDEPWNIIQIWKNKYSLIENLNFFAIFLEIFLILSSSLSIRLGEIKEIISIIYIFISVS